MSFAYPIVLLALVIPIGLIVLLWKHPYHGTPLPFDHQATTDAKWRDKIIKAANSIPFLILAMVILMMAGPRKFETPESRRKLTNIMFCLDVSVSMTAKFGDGDRYEVAMDSLNEFLTYRTGDAFSLMVFGDSNLRWVPLTNDVTAFRYAPPFLHPSKLPSWFSGGTAIGRALTQAEKFLLAADEGDRMIILLSDGQSADLFDGNDVKVANSLKDNEIVVYTVHIGSGTAPTEVSLISSITGGETFATGDPAALDVIFKQIDQMAQAPLERLTPDPIDHFRPFVLSALSLGGTYLFTLFGLRYTPW